MSDPPGDHGRCPVCGAGYVSRCRCPRADSTCEAGHRWHTCLDHGRVVLGHADHTRGGCTCRRSHESHPLVTD